MILEIMGVDIIFPPRRTAVYDWSLVDLIELPSILLIIMKSVKGFTSNFFPTPSDLQ